MPNQSQAMTMPLLPGWLAWVFAVALAVVVVLHLWHAHVMRGRARLWHAGHVLMAAGMIAMYFVSPSRYPDAYWVGVVVFTAAAVAMVAVGARWWRQERLLNWLWAASTVDMLVMAYMALPTSAHDAALTVVAVAYLAVEMVIWLSDPLPRMRRALRRARSSSGPGGLAPVSTPGMPSSAARSTPERPAQPAALAVERVDSDGESVRLVADVTLAVRLTLAVMSASMLWMLVAMYAMALAPVAGGTMTMPMGS